MNFFEHQDVARRSSGRLVLLFVVAVVLIVASLYVVAVFIFQLASEEPELVWWRPEVFVTVAGGATALIGLGSLYRVYTLRSGGSAVAELLGGSPVDPSTADPEARRLVNVVEEIAIASGTPVPQIYILENEAGINAFAAGYTPDDAAVAVTRGCLSLLTRDELQGVIAHEFSHILNGDMRLNIRLIGLLQGILVIASIGYILIRFVGIGRSSSGRGRADGAVAAIAFFGLAMLVIGYSGVFIGRLIKSAVSRQREFLADASAVQFTRNPGGIAGALKKIGGYSHGSRVENAHAEETSHLFFGNALGTSAFGGLLSTHPPLVERIRRIDPSFDGELREAVEAPPGAVAPAAAAGLAGFGPGGLAGVRHPAPTERLESDAKNVVDRVGAPGPRHLVHGAATLEAIPVSLRGAAHELLGAVSVVYALLLDRDGEQRRRQLEVIRRHEPPHVVNEVLRVLPAVDGLPPELRLPLVELSGPAFHHLSRRQLEHLRWMIAELVAVDEKMTVFEFALQKIVARRLDVAAGQVRRPVQLYSFNAVRGDVVVLLSAMARVGAADEVEAARAFAAGAARVPALEGASLLSPRRGVLSELDRAIDRLSHAAPPIKQRVLDAAAHTVMADVTVTIEEAELLRAVADALECPLPPFLPAREAAALG